MFLKSLLSFFFIWPVFGFCAFNVSGKIYSYNVKKIILIGWTDFNYEILSSGITDSHGFFNIRVTKAYIGKIYIKLENDILFHIMADGNDITLLLDYHHPNKMYIFNSKINKYFDKISSRLTFLNTLQSLNEKDINNVKNLILDNRSFTNINNYNSNINYSLRHAIINIKYIQTSKEYNYFLHRLNNMMIYRHNILSNISHTYRGLLYFVAMLSSHNNIKYISGSHN